MSSHNILKAGFVTLNADEKRIIDSNELVTKKLEKLSAPFQDDIVPWSGENFDDQDEDMVPEDQVNDLLMDETEIEKQKKESIQKEDMEGAFSREELLQNVQLEIEQMKVEAQEEIENIKKQVVEQARQEGLEKGYQEGVEQGRKQALEDNAVQEEKLKKLEAEFEDSLARLEPLFVEHLTSIYEHIFHVRLSDEKEIIMHLLDTALHGIESGKNFIIRVSTEDYPFVSMQKKKLLSNLSDASIEMVEDKTMKKNECLIETDGGIYDCSVDIELFALSNSLKLLAYRGKNEGNDNIR